MISPLRRPVLVFAILSSLPILAFGAWAAAPPVYKPPSGAAKRPAFVPLADTVVLARVNDRTIRVSDYIDRFFNAYIEFRPTADSLGRLEFLQRLVDKEILATVARSTKRQETFEDRATMKGHEQKILGNALFDKAVRDSVRITEAEAESVYAQMKRELHLERIRFGSLATAQRMRRDLTAGKMSWSRAWDLRLRVPGEAPGTTSEAGWFKRMALPPEIAGSIFSLPVGGISQPILEDPGYSLYRVKEERPAKIQEYRMFRGSIMEDIQIRKTHHYREQVMAGLRKEIDLRPDSATVAWVSSRYPRTISGTGTDRIVFDITTPTFDPADTGRVVARYKGGQVTVGRMLDGYRALPDLMRPSLDTPAGVLSFLEVMILEPRLAEVARQRGYDRDSTVIAEMERKREEIQVEHLFQDSILAKVFIPPAERRKYYKDNQHRFVNSPNARYAAFYLESKGAADSLAGRLKRGVPAHDIIRADSLAGIRRGQIYERTRDAIDLNFPQVFGEMKVGEISFIGPDKDGGYNVLQLIARDWGRPVPFEEADGQIDEYLQGNAANKMLAAFVERHARQMKIESHPELLMKIKLVPPSKPSDIPTTATTGRGS